MANTAIVGVGNSVVDTLVEQLGTLAGKRIAVLSLSFNLGTHNTRESLAFDVIRLLRVAGAVVTATDPAAGLTNRLAFPNIAVVDDPFAAAVGADAVVLWTDDRALDLDHLANAMRGRLIIDAGGVFNVDEAARAGLVYAGIGRTTMRPRQRTITVPASTIEPIALPGD